MSELANVELAIVRLASMGVGFRGRTERDLESSHEFAKVERLLL